MSAIGGEQLQIFNPIVGRVFVFVVNDLTLSKKSTKCLFHHQSVFVHIAAILRFARMVWCGNPNIATRVFPFSALPRWVFCSRAPMRELPPCPILPQEGFDMTPIRSDSFRDFRQ
jgi:hypothetical protein